MKNQFLSQDDIDAKVEYLFAHRFNKTLHAYIDISGDLVAGTLLSQIMYWFSDDKNGNQKVRVFRDGHYWIAKRREDWMREIRISKKQYDCAIKKLTGEIEPTDEEKKENPGNRGKRREKKFDSEKALVEVKTFHFLGVPTTHIRPITENINREILKWKQGLERELLSQNDNACSLNSPNGNLVNSQNGNMEITETGNYYNIYNNIYNKTEITNRDYNTETTDKKAFSKEKVSYKVFSSQSEEKMGEKRLPYNYSLKEFKIFIKDKIFALAREIDPDISDKNINEISEIITYFYDRYFRVMGHRHPILRDDVYKSIILSMMDPPCAAVDSKNKYDLNAYEDMIDHFFETDYGKCSGNRTDYKLPYFFSDKVFENLCWKGFYTGFNDSPDEE